MPNIFLNLNFDYTYMPCTKVKTKSLFVCYYKESNGYSFSPGMIISLLI